ncbi:MAG: 4Fe-4S binding protein [Bilophila wadsworthia]
MSGSSRALRMARSWSKPNPSRLKSSNAMGWTSSPARPGYPFHSQQEPEFSMPIFSIDAESCVNCGKCVKICPDAGGQDHA